jgi:hypothetical protein
VAVSAATRDGIPELLHRCDRILWADGRVPFEEVARGAPEPATSGDAVPRLLPAALSRVS